MTPQEALDVPMDPERNDAAASSVREYLAVLLGTLWEEAEGFSGKRPFGNSSWKWEVHEALVRAGAVPGMFDEDGYLTTLDKTAADGLVAAAIEVMCGVSTPVDG